VKIVSTQEKVKRIRSLHPEDLTQWEQGFRDTIERMELAGDISKLTDPQLDKLDQVYQKHFVNTD
jgi:hypothetical protein